MNRTKYFYFLLVSGLVAIGNTAFSQTVVTFSYTGSIQTYTVPAGVTSIDVDVRGAKGGHASSFISQGGNGGRVTGTISVTPGEVLEIYVGGQGGDGTTTVAGAGGFNGGGVSGIFPGSYSGGGGGGASDIRTAPYGFGDRIAVAGGGGGAGYNYSSVD